MTENQELTLKNIELSAEFSRYLFEHPAFENKLPQAAEVVLLPKYDRTLRAYNLALGREMEAKGESVAYVTVGRLRPKSRSRLGAVALAR